MYQAYDHEIQGDFSEGVAVPPTSNVDPSVGISIRTAALDGNVEQLQSLLQKYSGDPIIDEGDEIGTTALHTACSHGHVECVSLLLGAGANREVKNHYGQTPLAKTTNARIRELLSS